MAGYAMQRRAEAVLDELFATAMAIQLHGRTVLFVGVDVLALAASSVAAIRRHVEDTTGVDGAHILIAASHTHTGPTTVRIFDTVPDEAWLDVFHRQVASVAIEAFHGMEPATLHLGHATCTTLQYNRRTLDADGRAQMTLDQDADRSGLRVEGPTDPSVDVLSAKRIDGTTLGIAVNYANHLDVPTGARYSADYPGVLRDALHDRVAGRPVTIFLNGACGNLEHIDPLDPEALETRDRYDDRAGPQKMEELGLALANAALEALRNDEPLVQSQPPHVLSDVLHLPVRAVDPPLLDWAHQILGSGDATLHERIFANETVLVNGKHGQTVPFEVNAFRLGELAIVGLPAEVFVELGLEIKTRSPFTTTMIVELANGWVGYLPTERAFEAGGYEVRTCRSSQLEPDAARRIVDAAVALLHALHAPSTERRRTA